MDASLATAPRLQDAEIDALAADLAIAATQAALFRNPAPDQARLCASQIRQLGLGAGIEKFVGTIVNSHEFSRKFLPGNWNEAAPLAAPAAGFPSLHPSLLDAALAETLLRAVHQAVLRQPPAAEELDAAAARLRTLGLREGLRAHIISLFTSPAYLALRGALLATAKRLVDTDKYLVLQFGEACANAVVVFNSFANNGVGENGEEFRYTLEKLGVSSLHVIDKAGRWFNHAETPEVFGEIARALEPYEHVGVTGQSMGACGALLFTNYAPSVSRVLAFAPQFAMTSPFIEFDERFAYLSHHIKHHFYADFGRSPIPERCHILIGGGDKFDIRHASHFTERGFTVTTVPRGAHEVAATLKKSSKGNLLNPLLQAFCDFSAPFTTATIESVLAPLNS